jgi:hypothetical protein
MGLPPVLFRVQQQLSHCHAVFWRWTIDPDFLGLVPPLPGKMTPLQCDNFHHQGGLMDSIDASLQRGCQG